MSIILWGQYPRSEALVKATRDFDRKRLAVGDLETVLNEDYASFKSIQKDFPYYSPGLFHWDDLMRPYIEIIENCNAGPLVRFFETNTFWRRLENSGDFRLREETLISWIEKYFVSAQVYNRNDALVFTLPFLFLFRNFSQGISLGDIQTLLYKIIAMIDANFKGSIVFFEPFIGWESLDAAEKKQAIIFLEKIKSTFSIPISLLQCFSSLKDEKQFFYSLPVDSLGIDFYSNSLSEIEKDFPENKTLMAGILNTHSTLPELREHLVAFIARAKTFLPADKIVFTTSGPPELLPRFVLDNKLRHLIEVLKCC